MKLTSFLKTLTVLLVSLGVQLQTAHAGPKTQTLRGQATAVGKGQAHVFAEVGGNGAIHALGVAISGSALESVPKHGPMLAFVLHLPREVALPPYDHVLLDWNPMGHEPDGIYDKPHFDVHFYLMTLAERLAITCQGDDLAVCEQPPAPERIPQDYVPTPGGVPQMGAHWIDRFADEINGRPFTRTFIYGFYAGRMTFLEPMITLDHLLATTQEVLPVKQPEAYPKTGWYPTEYWIQFDALRDEYRIVLEGMVYRGVGLTQ